MKRKSSNQIPCGHILRGFSDTAIHPDYDPPVILLGQLPAPPAASRVSGFSPFPRGETNSMRRGEIPGTPPSVLNDVSKRGTL